MKRFYTLFLFFSLIFVFYSQHSEAQIQIGIKEGVGNKLILYFTNPNNDLLANNFDDFTITLKWPENTVNFTGLNTGAFNLSNGTLGQSGGYNYQILTTTNLGSVTLAADGSQLQIAELTYSYAPGGNCEGFFEIENDDSWVTLNNGHLKLIDGFNNTWNPTLHNITAGNLNPVKITDVTKQDVKCKGAATGSIEIDADDAFGGTLTYTVGVDTKTGINIFSALTAYSYTISVDNGTCTATYPSVVINEPSSSVAITSETATDITCNNANDGKISLAANGGTGSLQYSIDGGNVYAANTTYDNLTAGNYQVFVKDANECTVEGSELVINNPFAISIQSETKTDISCFGLNDGAINITAQGGTGTLYFSNDNGTNYVSNSGNFENLEPGTYPIKIKDANDCMISGSSFQIIEPSELTISNIDITPTSDCRATDGQIQVTANGGTGTIQYSLGGSTYQSADLFTNQGKGNYYVFVKDANECTKNEYITLDENNPVIIDSVSSSELLCHGDLDGEIIIHARGGVQPITYTIDNLNYYSSNVFANLPAANYAVRAKDANDCATTSTSVRISEPSPIEISIIDVENISTCYNDPVGRLQFSAIGGTGSLMYSLDGVSYQYSSIFEDIPGGTYDVQVKDMNECIGTITAIVAQPDELICNKTIKDITCFNRNDGEIKLAPSGGTSGYNIEWSVIDGDDNDNNLTGLKPGSYWFTITDAHECQISDTIEITRPDSLQMTSNVTDLTCYNSGDGVIETIISGGEAPYRYRWDNGQMRSTIENLSAGNYQLTVTDYRQCRAVFQVEVNQPSALSLNSEVFNSSYYGSNDGRITIDISGGTKPYYYNWEGEINKYSLPDNWSSISITDSLYDIPPGNYKVVVQDANFCTIKADFRISVHETEINIPKAFTPNGDYKNDKWIIPNIEKQEYNAVVLQIFDSRGYLVYTKDGSFLGWDGWDGADNSGTPLPGSTVYYYVLKLNNNTAPLKGTVYIIR